MRGAGQLLGWPHACQIRLDLCNRARGASRSQVNDGPVTTYKAEKSWSELPGDRHAVSANASDTKPAKLLGGVGGRHERDGTDDPVREPRLISHLGVATMLDLD